MLGETTLRISAVLLLVGGLASLSVALGLGSLQVVIGSGAVPTDVSVTEWVSVLHSLTLPAIAAGLVGLGLWRLGSAPAWGLGARLGVVGLCLGSLGATLAAVALLPAAPTTGWTFYTPYDATYVPQAAPLLSVGLLLGGVGWMLGSIGVIGIAWRRRAWPGPLEAAVVAVSVHTVLTEPLAAWDLLVRLVAPADTLWFNVRVPGRASPAAMVLSAGVLAQVWRTEGVGVSLDRAVAVGFGLVAGVSAVGLVGELPMAATSFLLASIAGTAYAVDAVLRGTLVPRLPQPVGVLSLVLWGAGLLGAWLLGASELSLMVHDTYAVLATEHLLGPILVSIVWVAGLSDLLRGRVGWGAWSVACACSALVALGTWRMGVGFATLGLGGMPRRYYDFVEHGAVGWTDVGIGSTSVTVGLWALLAAVALLAVLQQPGNGPRAAP